MSQNAPTRLRINIDIAKEYKISDNRGIKIGYKFLDVDSDELVENVIKLYLEKSRIKRSPDDYLLFSKIELFSAPLNSKGKK